MSSDNSCNANLAVHLLLNVCVNGSCSWVGANQSVPVDVPIGQSYFANYQCCTYDGAACNNASNPDMCMANGQAVPCHCYEIGVKQLAATMCVTTDFPVCGFP
jgi:hypothetical protein